MTTTPSSAPRVPSTTIPDGTHAPGTAGHDNRHMPAQQVDTPPRADIPQRRALVLGGGGAAGNAWEIGLIAGLSDAGVDVTRADLIVGTSAGATAAAQLTSGTSPADLYAAILAEAPQPPVGTTGQAPQPAARASATNFLEWSGALIGSADDAADMRRRVGAATLELHAPHESGRSRWREIVAARLPSDRWPQQRVLITAVDAQTGEPVVFDRHSGVDLVDAVAASTTLGYGPFPPYLIGEHRYLDGGFRRNENADLAAGHSVVLVLSPFSGRSRMPREWGMDLATQVDELRAGGSTVETVFPDGGAGDVFNAKAVDPSTRSQAARAGYDQGRALAQRLAEIWR